MVCLITVSVVGDRGGLSLPCRLIKPLERYRAHDHTYTWTESVFVGGSMVIVMLNEDIIHTN